VAELRGEPKTPKAEFAIAVAGPVASVVVGGFFTALGYGLSAARATPLAVAVASYLGVVNIVLAVFNLIPAAPLDGGRVLRAIVWWRTGDRVRAAIVAARAGKVFGFVLIAGGVVLVLLPGNGVTGLWWVLLGWFLVQAAAPRSNGPGWVTNCTV
jgi:Zn-dependent protease